MGEAAAQGLIMGLFFAFVSFIVFIYRWIRYKTREKLVDEQIKSDFLESDFMYLNGYKFDKKTVPENKNFETLLSIFRNEFKKGEITEVYSNLPQSGKKPWKVYATVKSGTWPFNDKEESMEIYSILDKELDNLEEYKIFKRTKPETTSVSNRD